MFILVAKISFFGKFAKKFLQISYYQNYWMGIICMTFSYPFAISHTQTRTQIWTIHYFVCLKTLHKISPLPERGQFSLIWSIRAQYILYRLITATILRIINRTSISGRRATRRDSYTITIINKGMCIYNKSA